MKSSALQKHSVSFGSLILVNADNTYNAIISEDHLVAVCESCSSVYMERRAAALLDMLMKEINGWNDIAPVSGWRTAQVQKEIWDNSMQAKGELFTRQYVAEPGHSEHETGLAIDLGLRKEEIDFIRPEFPDLGICRLFSDKAAEFGFILRYPKGKEHITGIAYEPWHFRYVGIPHAEIMSVLDFTLEEYHAFVKRFPYGEPPLTFTKKNLVFEISYLRLNCAEDKIHEVYESARGMVSGNNSDGYIITTWKNRES